jgi:ATP/maltotriose-dependent transcriptional regulator MalT
MSATSLESALALERRRILDLHDGLGASLIGLLQHVQSGRSDRISIERQIRQTLCEMRRRIEEAVRASDSGTPRVRRGDSSGLTAREIEVLSALSRGCSYAEIGVRLGVSLGTVTSHIKNIYRKLSVHSAAAAVTRAAELGILPSVGVR